MNNSYPTLRLALPKGRMQNGVLSLLRECGIQIAESNRSYRPTVSLRNVETKILKPHNIVEMLLAGSRDVGFAGKDWICELCDGPGVNKPVEILDTGLDPVQLVAAAPKDLLIQGRLPNQHLRVASEYERLTLGWIGAMNLDACFVKANGATEVFPPEDADLIVDNTATGSTLAANDLVIIDQLMRSSTRLYASQTAYDDPLKRQRIQDLKLLLDSVLQGRARRMIEVNVAADDLDAVIAVIPAMQKPTVSSLFGESGFAVRAAVFSNELPTVIPRIKSHGGRDIVVTTINQIVP